MKSLLNISDLNQNDFDNILQFADDLKNETEQILTNKIYLNSILQISHQYNCHQVD